MKILKNWFLYFKLAHVNILRDKLHKKYSKKCVYILALPFTNFLNLGSS